MSDFFATKIRALFSYMDFNKDGIVSKKDFEALADMFQDEEKTDPAVREKSRNFFVEVFRMYKSSAGSDDDGLLTPEIMTASVRQLRNDPKFLEFFATMIDGFFTLMDLNEDGYIQADEYARMFTTVGIHDLGFVKSAFDSIDLNHDGVISRKECIDAFVEYITTDDEKSPYKLLFGYLV